MRSLIYLASLFLVVSLVAGCNSDSEPKAAAVVSTATTTSTPQAAPPGSPTPVPSPTPSALSQYLLASKEDLNEVVRRFEPVAKLVDNPNPSDARWRTETRDAANNMKQIASTIRGRSAPACLQPVSAEMAKMAGALDRMSDEMIAGIDGQTTIRFNAAKRAADEVVVYLSNLTPLIQAASC